MNAFCFEKYLLQLKGVAGNSQQSLFPQTLTLTHGFLL